VKNVRKLHVAGVIFWLTLYIRQSQRGRHWQSHSFVHSSLCGPQKTTLYMNLWTAVVNEKLMIRSYNKA